MITQDEEVWILRKNLFLIFLNVECAGCQWPHRLKHPEPGSSGTGERACWIPEGRGRGGSNSQLAHVQPLDKAKTVVQVRYWAAVRGQFSLYLADGNYCRVLRPVAFPSGVFLIYWQSIMYWWMLLCFNILFLNLIWSMSIAIHAHLARHANVPY